ncbi:MAG: hypothetical protein B6I35_12515 [Anaerolineaceae bacterium 4572_32.2]|nr:MAG: hypothetical protein B6I35_12515 [Anaerolineaceae bacterium 4572_32.2]
MSDTKIKLQRLERILELVRELTSTISLEPLLHKIVKAAAELTDSETSAIMLLSERSGDLRFVAASNLVDQLVSIPVPIDASIGGASLSSGEPIIVPDARVDSRHYKLVDQLIGSETRSLLAVPLQFHDHRIGVLEAENKHDDGEFDQEDVETLTGLAAQATVAIENARLYYKAQQELDERERAEQELREHRDHLEELVAQRTAELTSANEHLQLEIAERKQVEETLRQHTLELETRNEELDAFAHTVAHDLKGPLGAMRGFVQVLEDGYATLSGDDMRDYLHMIAEGGNKMSDIIDELLLLSSVRKVEDIEVCPLDMGSIVDKVRRRLTCMIEEYQAEIVLPESWPLALGYEPWIEEAWVNYLSNAIKYSGRPPRIELGAASPPQAGMVRFWVRDNGPGLTPDEQMRMFTPFTRLDHVRAKGHGLGLSIVRRIVEKLGGQVGVESQEGQGSTFTFTLPLAPPK